jgi:hypothetical protein
VSQKLNEKMHFIELFLGQFIAKLIHLKYILIYQEVVKELMQICVVELTQIVKYNDKCQQSSKKKNERR